MSRPRPWNTKRPRPGTDEQEQNSRSLTGWSLVYAQFNKLKAARPQYGLQPMTSRSPDPRGCAWAVRAEVDPYPVRVEIDEEGTLFARAYDPDDGQTILDQEHCGNVFEPGLMHKLIPFLDKHLSGPASKPAPSPALAGMTRDEIEERLALLQEEGEYIDAIDPSIYGDFSEYYEHPNSTEYPDSTERPDYVECGDYGDHAD